MFSIFARIFRFVFSKAVLVVLLWVFVLGGVAVYLFGKNKIDEMPEEHKETIRQMTDVAAARKGFEAEYEKLKFRLGVKELELEAIADNIDLNRKKIQRIQNELSGLLSIFSRNKLENELADEKALLEQSEIEQEDASAKLEELRESSQVTQEKLDALDDQLAGLDDQLTAQKEEISWWEEKKQGAMYWFKRAFETVGGTLILVTVAILVLPLIFKIILYYVIAPLMSMANPIRINSEHFKKIDVSDTNVAKEIKLEPGDFAIIKPEFYQASDERLQKRTKFVFDWRYPFTSAACGLIEMTRVKNVSGDDRLLTLSSQEEAEVELTLVNIPDGGSVILRPRYLAGFCGKEGKPPRIRTHWKLFSLHSWLTLQFRFFEFEGPGQLAVWALRGVRAEILTKKDIEQRNRKRTNQDATIGFTPTLKYHSIKAETFWAYLRGQNPLFDDIFTGEGTFLCQQISRNARGGIVRRFWEGLWNGITKIFGL